MTKLKSCSSQSLLQLIFRSLVPGFCLLILGCFGTGTETTPDTILEAPPPPEWALTGKTPEISGEICAIGVAGPTFFKTDAKKIAAEEARCELARTIHVKIETNTIDIQINDRGLKDTQTVFEVSSYLNDIIMEGSRIIEIWYDKHGKGFIQKPNCTYVITCIEKNAISSAK